MKYLFPFIVLDDCKKEIGFYRDILGGEIHVLNETEDKLLHCEFEVDGRPFIHFADVTAANTKAIGDYAKIMVECESEEEIRNIYATLSVGGRVDIELFVTPFNALIGTVTDRNGVGWVLRCFRD